MNFEDPPESRLFPARFSQLTKNPVIPSHLKIKIESPKQLRFRNPDSPMVAKMQAVQSRLLETLLLLFPVIPVSTLSKTEPLKLTADFPMKLRSYDPKLSAILNLGILDYCSNCASRGESESRYFQGTGPKRSGAPALSLASLAGLVERHFQ